MKYLLDTNAWIDILNKPTGVIAAKLATHAPSEVALCAVVLSELLVGAYKCSQQAANLVLIHQLVLQFICLPFDEVGADHYARLRSYRESVGQPIGPHDMQIAAIAEQHGLIVVTHNFAEFSRVPALIIEDWMIP